MLKKNLKQFAFSTTLVLGAFLMHSAFVSSSQHQGKLASEKSSIEKELKKQLHLEKALVKVEDVATKNAN